MIRVRNRRVIDRLALRSLRGAGARNGIAVAAILLTTALFCALFTIALTLLDTFEQETFRQVGTSAHGGFKNLTTAQMEELAADPRIRAGGGRLMLGTLGGDAFLKDYGEISYMDPDYAAMSFYTPTAGALPAEGTRQLACDTRVLERLGIEPALGAEVPLTFQLGADTGSPQTVTDTFTLSGWWEYDAAGSACMALVPRSYAEEVLAGYTRQGATDPTGMWSLNVLLRSAADIEGSLRAVLADHGYQCDDPGGANYVGIGTNWGYLSVRFDSLDLPSLAAMGFVLAVILLTGYLIIYNIFQISVAGDIRRYGLLKTIGTTPRQIRALVRRQALALSLAGIPAGLALGYLLGAALAPTIRAVLDYQRITISRSPAIFVLAAVFALGTVLLSCAKPARMAARVSPIEAVRYTEGGGRPPRRRTRRPRQGGRPVGMALANLGRSPRKTALAVASLALAVGLLQLTVAVAMGFDLDKYLSNYVLTDFVLGDAAYFRQRTPSCDLSEADAAALRDSGLARDIGGTTGWYGAQCFMPEKMLRDFLGNFSSEEAVQRTIDAAERDEAGHLAYTAQLYGLDETALGRVELLEGDLSALRDPDRNALAAVYAHSDDGVVQWSDNYARVGDVITLRYVDEWEYYNLYTGEALDDPDALDPNQVGRRPASWRDVDYEVAACISVPVPMSFRSYSGPQFALNDRRLARDSGGSPRLLNLCFDTAEGRQADLEDFLDRYVEDTTLDFESREQYAGEFRQVRGMFLLLGGALSGVVALVGVLNFANALLTSILARRREFAMLQAVGMTGRQLRRMLVTEGLLYAALAGAAALVLCLLAGAAARTLQDTLWFFTYRFSLLPLAVTLPCFAALGALLPPAFYRAAARRSLVERLRQAE